MTTGGGPRVTELPNDLTKDIDKCDPLGIVRLLRQSDAQLFAGWGNHDSIYDTKILQKINVLASRAASMLKENEHSGCKTMFLFTGCGTSGRIAWASSRSFNRILTSLQKEPCFHYLIAGGDKALIVGDELPEDDPPRGAQDLMDLTRDRTKVMLVGITCGLSAPYVAGQVDYAMQKENFTTVLIGFNPVNSARDSIIEKWDKTCKQIFSRLEKLEQESTRGMILNPIVGPEPITGSSRMKGGSMTALLLDVIFSLAISRAFSIPLSKFLDIPPSFLPSECSSNLIPVLGSNQNSVEQNGKEIATLENGKEMRTSELHELSQGQHQVALCVDAFSATYNSAYRPTFGLASLIHIAGASLRHHEGHVYYVGAELFGIVGFIDSSEMVSTFGSSPSEVRGFVKGGWKTCQNRDGNLSEEGLSFCISLSDFEQNILQSLKSSDCVMWLRDGCRASPSGFPNKDEDKEIDSVIEKVLNTPARCCLLSIVGRENDESSKTLDPRYACSVLVKTPYFHVGGIEPLFGAFALKLILNTISTGANILKGRVYGNTMINLTVANDKLFYRSISIIAELSKVSEEDAKTALLKAIYKDDTIVKYLPLPVSQHIKAAARQNMMVPLALILAHRGCRIVEAVDIITGTKSLRVVIDKSM